MRLLSEHDYPCVLDDFAWIAANSFDNGISRPYNARLSTPLARQDSLSASSNS